MDNISSHHNNCNSNKEAKILPPKTKWDLFLFKKWTAPKKKVREKYINIIRYFIVAKNIYKKMKKNNLTKSIVSLLIRCCKLWKSFAWLLTIVILARVVIPIVESLVERKKILSTFAMVIKTYNIQLLENLMYLGLHLPKHGKLHPCEKFHSMNICHLHIVKPTKCKTNDESTYTKWGCSSLLPIH
jgi:hypothetical protein